MKEILLLKDGEIVLKGLNRRQFEDVLKKNIKIALHGTGRYAITSAQSTIYVKPLDDEADLDEATERIGRVFGLVSYSRAAMCPEKTLESVLETAPGNRAGLSGKDTAQGKDLQGGSQAQRQEIPLQIPRDLPRDRRRDLEQISASPRRRPQPGRDGVCGDPRFRRVHPRRSAARRWRYSRRNRRQGGDPHQRRHRFSRRSLHDGKTRSQADRRTLCAQRKRS